MIARIAALAACGTLYSFTVSEISRTRNLRKFCCSSESVVSNLVSQKLNLHKTMCQGCRFHRQYYKNNSTYRQAVIEFAAVNPSVNIRSRTTSNVYEVSLFF